MSDGLGMLIVIVGPSGSGKDTLINWLKDEVGHDQRFLFVQRTITRVADGQTENHDAVSVFEFLDMAASGAFAVTWEAHGLHYGLGIAALRHVQSGGISIVNGSRRALGHIKAKFPNMMVIQLEVDHDILATRLTSRGRETNDQIEQRLDQIDLPIERRYQPHKIDNSGNITDAGRVVLNLINQKVLSDVT